MDWPGLARERVTKLLEIEHAVVWPEVEAKLAEGAVDLGPRTVDPHHLVNARNQFLGDGTLAVDSRPTRGGSEIPVYYLAGATRRRRAIEDAGARKRLLHARYRGWARGTKTGVSLTGRALESVVHNSLRAAAPGAGYRLINPARGEFRSILDVELPGPVDNGGFMMPIDPAGSPAVVLVEAKNLRDWVYPSAIELYQLLAKAAFLQVRQPDWLIVPVFVCRRAHFLTREMGAELGFYPIETKRQYIQPGRTDDELGEVRNELGYNLEVGATANPVMTRHFERFIPTSAVAVGRRWRRTAMATSDLLNDLWRTSAYQRRMGLLDDFGEATRALVPSSELRVWRRTEGDPGTFYEYD